MMKELKRKRRFVTDVITGAVFVVSGVFEMIELAGGISKFKKFDAAVYTLYLLITFVSAFLFINDALCTAFPARRERQNARERKCKLLSILTVVLIVLQMPIGWVTLFFKPMGLVSIIFAGLLKQYGAQIVAAYVVLDAVLIISAFVNVWYMLEEKNKIVTPDRQRHKFFL